MLADLTPREWILGASIERVRDIIRTETCNACHSALAFHGVEESVLLSFVKAMDLINEQDHSR